MRIVIHITVNIKSTAVSIFTTTKDGIKLTKISTFRKKYPGLLGLMQTCINVSLNSKVSYNIQAGKDYTSLVIHVRFFLFQGKGLFAVRDIAQGDVILQEEPLVCAQFHWNSVYKYLACNHCMKSIERAEEMAQRLSDNPSVVLPHPECCSVKTDEHTICPQCQVRPLRPKQ